ncbi:MAG: methylated-DNA--[protein]-cysteine S-methyltransferase [Treponema sp.]|nr:methylated-DNA--[protein]-cysteine S-methyltransferase [Treponema sp.]
MKYYYNYSNKFCNLFIIEENNTIHNVRFKFEEKLFIKKSTELKKLQTPLIKETIKQLDEYFSGKRKTFDLPLNAQGTEFQKKVWQVLKAIPYGQTCSYEQIAIKTGNPKACRAVGLSNNKNPIVIIIPCHRVIGKNGKLTGYAGGLELKQKLLDLEK